MIKVTEMTEFASRRAAGLFESVRGLSSALQREGLAEVRIVTQRDAFSDLDRPGWGNVDLEYVVPGGRLRWLTGGDMADAFLRAPADVVHVHSLWTCAERGMVNLVRRGVRTPYVFAPRGSMSPWAMNYKRWKKRLSWPVWEAALLSHASCLHALNAAEADMIRRIEKRVPICVVSNGIDLPQMIDIEKGNRRKLLYLGRLHPIKGLTELIKGWSCIPASVRKDWQLVLAGWDDSGEGDNYRALAAQLAPDSIEFPGGAFGVEKERLYREATAFILASQSEGMPSAVLEAWSYGLPVVMTNACNLPVGFERRAAVRVEPQADDITAVLTEFLARSDSDLETMGAAGRQLVEERFSWSTIAAEMARVYNWVCGRGPQPNSVILP